MSVIFWVIHIYWVRESNQLWDARLGSSRKTREIEARKRVECMGVVRIESTHSSWRPFWCYHLEPILGFLHGAHLVVYLVPEELELLYITGGFYTCLTPPFSPIHHGVGVPICSDILWRAHHIHHWMTLVRYMLFSTLCTSFIVLFSYIEDNACFKCGGVGWSANHLVIQCTYFLIIS